MPCCTCKGKRTTSGTGPHLCLFAPSLLFAAMYIRLAGPRASRDSPVPASHIPGRMMDYSNGHHNVSVLHGFWDWNSDTHTNMANVLPLTHLPKLEVFVYLGFPTLSELSEKKIGNVN